jgi:PPP family 3-phenylpropionic acid transporter
MLTDRALVLFLVTIFLVSLTLGAANSFFSLYLNGLGAEEGAIGLAWAIAALSEIPVMLYSGRIMRRIGARGLLYIALLTFAGRWLLYSFIRAPALAIAVQALHGLSFATYLVGGVTYMSEHAPAGLSTTAQSLFNLVAFGLGSIAGSLVGGYLYQTAGVTVLFRVLSAVAAGGLALFLVSQRWSGHAPRDRVPALDSAEP